MPNSECTSFSMGQMSLDEGAEALRNQAQGTFRRCHQVLILVSASIITEAVGALVILP